MGALLLRDAYRALDAVGAISPDDAARLQALGVRGDRMSITGDTRYDEAWARAQSLESRRALLEPLRSDRPTLVAGSTWRADDAPLLEAWRIVRERVPSARLVIAPHEPSAAHLTPIARWAAESGLRCASVDDPTASTADVVLIDRVGVLGDLYALAAVAYVGGGFHAAGLHSVIEPAAFGVPVIFGPRHAASRDAGLLLECGGGFSAASAGEIAGRVLTLFEDKSTRSTAGNHARTLVQAGLGAADRSVGLVEKLLASSI